MANDRNSLDGFVPRRRGGSTPTRHIGQADGNELPSRFTRVDKDVAKPLQSRANRADLGISKNDIDSSLKGIDTLEDPKGKSKGKKGRVKKPISKKRRIIKWSIIVLVLILLGFAGFMVYKALNAGSSIFKGSLLDIVQTQPLKQDENGRSNILVLGTSEDDPGHGGAYLTDSMMVISLDQNKKVADMFSIPRDLYVDYGRACNSGYQGKINEYFNCVNGDWSKKNTAAEEERLTKTREFVGKIFGLDVQYAVHVNNTVIKEAVDAVGGVDVEIKGSGGAPGILDRNFDWRCNYQCYLVKYDNGVHHLDGKHALYLAMARGDVAPTYGLGNSNFDREKNQQKIIVALKEKAASTGTLTNPAKVMGLIDALGNNLRTNFETKEIRTLMNLANDIKSESIQRLSLYDEENQLVKSGNMGGASVVIPSAGAFNYAEIQAFLKQKLSSNEVTREGAKVVVLNGSETPGVAQTQADKLTEKGFTVSSVDNAPDGTYETVEIYQIGKGMSATKSKLESLFGTKIKTGKAPATVAAGTNFVVIFGKDPDASN